MAGEVRFKKLYHMEVVAGRTYTSSDLPNTPEAVTIDTIELVDATFLSGVVVTSEGKVKLDNNEQPVYSKTDIRGIRMSIKAPDIEPNKSGENVNVPGIIQVGQQIIFDEDYEYTCTEGYGVVALGVKEL